MKQLLVFAILSLVMYSCSGNKNKAETSNKDQTSYELDKLLAVADQEVDKTLTVVGYVTHTCVHSGQRCFITGESQEASIRVEAGGEISGFDMKLIGSKLAVTGVLKENRLSQEYIAGMEKDVQLMKEGGESVEACEAELSNISDMRKWMRDHDKDYYVIYYMDGLNYETLD